MNWTDWNIPNSDFLVARLTPLTLHEEFQQFDFPVSKGKIQDMSLSELWEMVMDREAWRSARVGHDWATELNWTKGKTFE